MSKTSAIATEAVVGAEAVFPVAEEVLSPVVLEPGEASVVFPDMPEFEEGEAWLLFPASGNAPDPSEADDSLLALLAAPFEEAAPFSLFDWMTSETLTPDESSAESANAKLLVLSVVFPLFRLSNIDGTQLQENASIKASMRHASLQHLDMIVLSSDFKFSPILMS